MTRCSASLGAALLGFFSVTSQICAENTPIPKPDCDGTKGVSIRYSSTSDRLYVESLVDGERGGCVTLLQIFNARGGKAPLYAVDPVSGERVEDVTGTWLITASVVVEDGVTLNVHGGLPDRADELRILSDNTTVLNLRAHGGSLSFENTRVFSWDENANTYDTNTDDGRSYISAVSEIMTDPTETCIGKAQKDMGESRMDIVSSEMAYLGFQGSESYGLTWKVRGFCKDGSNPEVFDDVNVYGNIYDSSIHDNWFGMYTYGHQQGDWRRNQMFNNIQYGFDPHDDSDFLNIHDNVVYNNGNHGIIASKRCNGVSIQNNIVFDGGQAGLFLHRLSDDAIVKGNHVYNNDDAGLAFLESNDALVTGNTFENNKYGVRLSVGSARNIIKNNVITGSEKYNIYTYEGTDSPYEAATGRMQDIQVVSNIFEGGNEAIKLQQADSTVFLSNSFNTTTTIRFADSNHTLMSGNTGLAGAEVKIREAACFDAASDAEFTPVCG